MTLTQSLSSMISYRQFILWIKVQKNDKLIKLPLSADLTPADTTNPATWTDYETALRISQSMPDVGIGFVFTKEDPFFFLDIDNAIAPSGDKWTEGAQAICSWFPGAMIEISQSNRGLHIIGSATAIPEHGCKPKTPDKTIYGQACDLYTEERFIALTGNAISGNAGSDHTTTLYSLIAYGYMGLPGELSDWDDLPEGPDPEYTCTLDDDGLLEKALGSKSAASQFSTKASFSDLFNGNTEVLAVNYPHDQGTELFDASAVDAALLSHLAFWTGKDKERIERLFDRSILGTRDKWTDREDYRKASITYAIQKCNRIYNTTAAKDNTTTVTPGTIADGWASIEDQKILFKNFIYVGHLNQILTPEGILYNPERFKNMYGGFKYQMDYANESRPCRNAFEAFTQSEALRDYHQKVDLTCFRPRLPPRHVFIEDGRRLINTYVPVEHKRLTGDPSPYLTLLRTLCRTDRDYRIQLSFFAALVQNPGVKFSWAPVIVGAEGNGKSTLLRHLIEAVSLRYTHLPNAGKLDNSFNSWVAGKILIGIEEIRAGRNSTIMDALKPLVTNPYIQIEPKGVDAFMMDNTANFVLLSNYPDAVRKTGNDRRYAVFYCPQQSMDEKISYGLTDQYFVQYYNWANAGGFEIVTDFLLNYQIEPEFNPAEGCRTAPQTSSTDDAIEYGRTAHEMAVLEAVEGHDLGFKGGWISGAALTDLLATLPGKRLFNRSKRDLLRTLGYSAAPNLAEGRAGRNIIELPEAGRRPKLYLRNDLIEIHRQYDGKALTDMYVEAQSAAD